MGLTLTSKYATTFDLSTAKLVQPYHFISKCYKLNIELGDNYRCLQESNNALIIIWSRVMGNLRVKNQLINITRNFIKHS